MKRSTSTFACTAVVAGLAVALAACNGAQPEPAQTAPPAAEQSRPDVPAPAALSVASVQFGRYVEPKTFAVGGVGRRFKATDSLFAAVRLEGTATSANVLVRLTDTSGQIVAEQNRAIQPKKPMKVNFALSQVATAPIVAGAYTAETLLDGQVVDTTQITIE